MKEKNLGGEAFNLSTNNPVSVIDLVNKIIKLFGSELQPKILNEAKGEIIDQYLTSNKAMEVLGWKPEYTLDQGLTETIEWYKNYLQTKISNK